jgi:hypothetical protein
VSCADQQRWDTVGAYGSPLDVTLNPGAVADELKGRMLRLLRPAGEAEPEIVKGRFL